TESEAHFVAHENRMGEFADGDLTDDDLRRDLEPVFGAIAAVRRSIEEKLDGLARLAFHLGELLDRGTRPPNVYRHLGRTRAARNQGTPARKVSPKKLKRGERIKWAEEDPTD